MNEFNRPTVSPAPIYRAPRAALASLEGAFGFETSMVVEGADGPLHCEMRFGDGLVVVGSEYDVRHASPVRCGGRNTQSIHVQLETGIDAHCAQARAAGAEVVRELADQPYGERIYAAQDPDGHVWSFGQVLQPLSNESIEAATGAKIRDRL